MWKKLPTPWKIMFPIIIIFILGFSIYNFVQSNPLVKILIFSPICLIISLILYKITKKLSDIWGIFLGISVVFLFWMYFLMIEYRNYTIDEKHGLKRLICNPHGICSTDNTEGPFNGSKLIYKYNDNPNGIFPGNLLKNDNTGEYTYMFWLKLDYVAWRYYTSTENKVLSISELDNVIEQGNTKYFVEIDKNTNKVIINIKNNSIEFTAPFKKWVHYAIVIDQQICSIYKNAVLERTFVLENSIEETSDIKIGGDTMENNEEENEEENHVLNGFSGYLQYLYYFNDALSYASIYKLYKQQYLSITGVKNDPYNKRSIKDECGC